MAKIVFDGVTKEFGDEVVAVDDLSLEIEDGEFMVLVGPSGCGKSTILRMLAGLEEVTAGEIWIDDTQVTDLSSKERDIAMVFQNYALYPHMTVEENIAFGLKLRRVPKAERGQKAREVARVLAIEHLLERKPAALSGGQRQRVAMGRAMIREPVAFLMDEPLSNLDAKLRVQMRAELTRLHERLAHHHRLRHARPGGGDDPRRPGRRPPRRPAPAGGHPAAPVRAARQPVRRRVRRVPADEPGRGHRPLRLRFLRRVRLPARRRNGPVGPRRAIGDRRDPALGPGGRGPVGAERSGRSSRSMWTSPRSSGRR